MRLAKKLAWVAAALVATVAVARPGAADPMKLRIQWPSAPGNITVFMPHAPAGVLKHYGKTYTVEPVFMAGSTPALQGLASGDLEIATFTPSALMLAVTEAHLDVRGIAQMLTTDYPGYAAPGFWVDKTKIKTIDDLKGKIIAVNAHGSAIDAAQKLVMKRHGMIEGRDYQTVEVRIPAMLPTLETGRVDAAFLLRPFDLRAAQNPKLGRLFTMGDAFGPSETGFWVAKTAWIAKHRQVVLDLVEDNIRLRRWLLDPKNRTAAVAMVAKVMKQPAKNFEGWVFTKRDTSYQQPDAKIDVARLQKNIDDMKEAGVMPRTIKAADYVDETIAAEAAARVK